MSTEKEGEDNQKSDGCIQLRMRALVCGVCSHVGDEKH